MKNTFVKKENRSSFFLACKKVEAKIEISTLELRKKISLFYIT